jgi:hypothetical protein
MAKIAPNITNSIQTIILAIITMCGFYLVFRQLKTLENKIAKIDQKKLHNIDNKDGVTQQEQTHVKQQQQQQQQQQQEKPKQEKQKQETQNMWNNDFAQSESDDDDDSEEENEEIEEQDSETDTEEIYPKEKTDDGYGEAELAQQKEIELAKQREYEEIELAKQR